MVLITAYVLPNDEKEHLNVIFHMQSNKDTTNPPPRVPGGGGEGRGFSKLPGKQEETSGTLHQKYTPEEQNVTSCVPTFSNWNLNDIQGLMQLAGPEN